MLLFIIAFISLLMTFSAEILKLFEKLKPARKVPAELKAKLDAALAEHARLQQEQFENSDRIDCTIRLMRAEEKVKQLKSEVLRTGIKNQFNGYLYNTACNYGFKAVLSLVLTYISWSNLKNPVFTFGDCFNLQPLTGLLSFPTGVYNAISVPVWILSCNVTFKFAYKHLKTKLKF